MCSALERTLWSLSHMILSIPYEEGFCYYSQCTGEETETQFMELAPDYTLRYSRQELEHKSL